MGCDIHVFTEVKIKGQWYAYGHPNVYRSYTLFALMAGVRNSQNIMPISLPKGIPDDCSNVVQHAAEDGDGHSHSWLSATEIVELEDRWYKINPDHNPDLEHHLFGYLEGNSWAGFTRYPDSRPEWIEDVRFVFWFDN